MDILAGAIAPLLPAEARVLDVGAGDGSLAAELARLRPDVRVEGVDVLVRPDTAIPVSRFDGVRLPFDDDSVDAVLLVDVVHHAERPRELLAETHRVARGRVVVKDHCADGPLARPTLRFMDRIGNRRHGVALTYGYWPRARWEATLRELRLDVVSWQTKLGLYPWPASLVFERSLHFLAALAPA